MQRRGETGDPRENPPTNGIVRRQLEIGLFSSLALQLRESIQFFVMKESADGIMALPLTLLGVFGLWHSDGRLAVCVGRLLRCLTLALSASFELSLLRAYSRVVEDPVMAFRALGWHSTIVPTYIMAYSLLASKGTYVRIMMRKTADDGSEATGRIFSAATAQGRRLIAFYLSLGTVYTLSTWAVPLLMHHLGPSSQTRVPYDIWFPVASSDPTGLVAQYVFQSVGIEISTYMVIVCDMFFISLILKMIGDFKTLNGALARLKAEDAMRAGIIFELRNEHLIRTSNILAVNTQQKARKEMDSKLMALIQYHQDLLR
ncbi:hypothetical protein PR048_006862 [Dryococelus australis]|uniref:Odorant receptor n=1 Tax=Dryococelus australis TaxID=614101 RepID=A0ABQ9IDG1_9NEOP|nr:hypothetical protein PR048_006862 [Dryococelus australis]